MKDKNKDAAKKNSKTNFSNSTVDYKYSPKVETPNPKAKAKDSIK